MSTIRELLEMNNEVFLAVVDRRLGVFKAEIQASDYWVGGDEGGWTNDSNVYFETALQAENYYKRTYKEVYAFEDEYDADNKCDELEALNG